MRREVDMLNEDELRVTRGLAAMLLLLLLLQRALFKEKAPCL